MLQREQHAPRKPEDSVPTETTQQLERKMIENKKQRLAGGKEAAARVRQEGSYPILEASSNFRSHVMPVFGLAA